MSFRPTLEKLWWPIVLSSAVLVYIVAMVFSAQQSIWFDEGYSILLAKSSWPELFALTAIDAHPPFYYALLKIWGSLFGFSEFALRSLSAVLLSGSLIVGMALLRKLFSTKVALYALPFIILAPFLIRYGYEVRMYSLATLIGTSATYALVVAKEKKKWWRWGVYGALVALGMYTLYMTLVIWLAHFVWLLAGSLRAKKRLPIKEWRWLYAYGFSILLFAAYLPTFIYQNLNSALPGVGAQVTLTKLGDMVSMLFTFTPEWGVNGWLTLLIVAGVILVAYVGTRVFTRLTTAQKGYYLLLCTLILVPITFYALTSLPPKAPIYINRYLAHVAVFVYMLVGVTLALGIVHKDLWKKTKSRVPYVAYAVTLAIVSIGIVQLQATGNFVFERMQHPQTREIRQAVDCNDAVVVADDPYTYIDSVFYFDDCNMRFYSEQPVEYKGGYAMLHNSPLRINDSSELTVPHLYHLHWTGNDPAFSIDDRYQLVETITYDKQVVQKYVLIEE